MKRDYIVDLIHQIIGNKALAETIVRRLEEEDLLKMHYGDQEVGKILETFKEVFETSKVTKYYRFAAYRLANKHGADVLCQIIKLLGQRRDYEFAPVVNSISEVESKWVSIIKFLRKTKPVEVEL